MDAQTTTGQNSSGRVADVVTKRDVLAVSLAVAAIVFGNMFLVRALDIALDAFAR